MTDGPLVGVLALQGDFDAHAVVLRRLRARVREVSERLGLGVEGVLDSGLPAAIPPTIYARIGDIPAAMIVAAALIMVIRRRAKTV